MADEIKFSEDELKSLQGLQNSYQEKQLQFGQLKVQNVLLSQQMEALETREVEVEEEYAEVQKTEQKLVEDLNEKYGPGSLDPASGVFTPQPPAPAEGKVVPEAEAEA
tara:strand:- start:179 stop:502 length:324 start_codon:yes stop_codon:yes gene_type:complete